MKQQAAYNEAENGEVAGNTAKHACGQEVEKTTKAKYDNVCLKFFCYASFCFY